MKRELGNWRVVRNCCITGYCWRCQRRGTVGRPQFGTIEGTGYSERYARYIAEFWKEYNPIVEEITDEAQR